MEKEDDYLTHGCNNNETKQNQVLPKVNPGNAQEVPNLGKKRKKQGKAQEVHQVHQVHQVKPQKYTKTAQ